jgi:hypothetical protein
MAMTDKEQREVRNYSAFLLKEYGFDIPLNDPVMPALYIIHKEMELTNQSNKAIASEVKRAASKINPTVFNFNNEDAAFKFQMGIGVKWFLYGCVIAVIAGIGAWHWSNVNKVEEAENIVQNSGKLGEMLRLVKRDNEGFYIIDFTAAKADSVEFLKEFRKMDEKTVRIYLARETK